MCIRQHQFWFLTLPLLVTSCDLPAPPPNQGPVIQKGGQAYGISGTSQVQFSASNEVRISSRAQVAGRQLQQTEWWVDRAVIERQPRWEASTEEPPLSVQKATALALPRVSARFPEVKEWLVHTIYMRNLLLGGKTGSTYSYPNIWVYEIEFSPKDEKMRKKLQDSVGVHGLTQIVLLDGTVVSPRDVK